LGTIMYCTQHLPSSRWLYKWFGHFHRAAYYSWGFGFAIVGSILVLWTAGIGLIHHRRQKRHMASRASTYQSDAYPNSGYATSGYGPSGYAPSGYAPSGYAPSGSYTPSQRRRKVATYHQDKLHRDILLLKGIPHKDKGNPDILLWVTTTYRQMAKRDKEASGTGRHHLAVIGTDPCRQLRINRKDLCRMAKARKWKRTRLKASATETQMAPRSRTKTRRWNREEVETKAHLKSIS